MLTRAARLARQSGQGRPGLQPLLELVARHAEQRRSVGERRPDHVRHLRRQTQTERKREGEPEAALGRRVGCDLDLPFAPMRSTQASVVAQVRGARERDDLPGAVDLLGAAADANDGVRVLRGWRRARALLRAPGYTPDATRPCACHLRDAGTRRASVGPAIRPIPARETVEPQPLSQPILRPLLGLSSTTPR